MAYSDFTLKDVTRRFQLHIEEKSDLFLEAPEVASSPLLHSLLQIYTPLALAIHTEKARSELLIAPVLVEVVTHASYPLSLFSGIDFSVAPEQGLNGICDFLLSLSSEQLFVTAPVVLIVEAKNENLKGALGQCVAEMVAAQLFNAREGNTIAAVYGVVTTGSLWQFLKLQDLQIIIDRHEYHLERIAKILGIFMHIVRAVQSGLQPSTMLEGER